MRVLLTTDTIGGVWTYTRELTEGLLERSHSVALVSLGRYPSSDQKAWCSTLRDRYPNYFRYVAVDTPLEWMSDNGAAYTGAEALLLNVMHELKADVLHTNQFCFGALPTTIPKLVVAHSDVLSWGAACRRGWLEGSSWLVQYVDLVQRGLLAANALVAPTEWMLQSLAERFSLPQEAFVILNGRDLPGASKALRSAERSMQAVTVGRLWDEAKGLATLADVTAPMPIYVAGEACYQSETVPATLGQAILLGRLEDETLYTLLRSSSIYLALSRYEPFGLAPLEAALCGCAVVARNLTSLREVWGEAALYFDDAGDLSDLLSTLASDIRLRSTYQERSSRRAQRLTRARMTELYLDLYRHLLEPSYRLRSTQMGDEVPSRVS